MHPSAHAQMGLCIRRYMSKKRRYRVLDFGARIAGGQSATHRELLEGYDHEYLGVDVMPGRNVDLVMTKPYRIPLKSGSVDVILSGQTFEHIPFFWVSFLELARVLRPGGHIFITAPSRGHKHGGQDCWRYYPDSMRALAAFSGLKLREAYTDWPPLRERRWHDYARIEATHHYWGDTVGVFRKPKGHRRSIRVAIVREVLVWWANRVGGLSEVPKDTLWKRRNRLLPPRVIRLDEASSPSERLST